MREYHSIDVRTRVQSTSFQAVGNVRIHDNWLALGDMKLLSGRISTKFLFEPEIEDDLDLFPVWVFVADEEAQ